MTINEPFLYSQKSGDDTSLNGIELTCADGQVIHSVIGPWGTWGGRLTCRAGEFVKGAKIRDHTPQEWGDDTAANGMKFECTDGQILSPGNGWWGSWSAMKTCPEGDVVYGIRTSVVQKKELRRCRQNQKGCRKRQRRGVDNLALNRVKFLCRKMGKNLGRIKTMLKN